MLRDRKRAGVRRIREGTSFDVTADILRNRLSEHPIVWLRDDRQAVGIAATLGGRILEWHAMGRQWLAEPDPENVWLTYPMSEGYAELAILGVDAHRGWSQRYRCRRRADGSWALTADLDEGLRLWRRYALVDGALRITSRLTNRSAEPVRAGWGGGFHLALPDAQRVCLPRDGGSTDLVVADIPDGVEHAAILDGDRGPRGSWRVELPGFRITGFLAGTAVVRAIVGRKAATGLLAVDFRTETMELSPGRRIEVRQAICIEGQ